MRTAVLIQVSLGGSPLSASAALECQLSHQREVNGHQAGQLEVGNGKEASGSVPGSAHQLLIFWFTEQTCGASVPWTQAKCLYKSLGIFLWKY